LFQAKSLLPPCLEGRLAVGYYGACKAYHGSPLSSGAMYQGVAVVLIVAPHAAKVRLNTRSTKTHHAFNESISITSRL